MLDALHSLIGAAPTAPGPSVADALAPLYLLVGTAVAGQIIGLGFSIVRWLGARTVEREDKDKEYFRAQLHEHEEHFQKLEHMLNELSRVLDTTGTEAKGHHGTIEALRGAIKEIKEQVETRFDKQAEFYRGQLKDALAQVTEKFAKLEFDVRQDTTRAIYDAATLRRSSKEPR